MTNDEIYDFIGELAIALYSKKVQISLGALRAIMLDKGKDYVNNRGMASAVSAAYRRWKTKDPIIYYAIAYTYTDKEGNLAWDEPKKATPAPVKETVQKEAEKQQDLFEEKPAETVTEEEIAVPEEVSSEEPVPPEEEKPVSKKKTGAKKAVAKKK